MKSFISTRKLLSIAVVLCGLSLQSPAEDQDKLEAVLSQMDKTAANFRTTEANFVWNQYQKVVDETDSQKGRIYFRRSNGEVQMAADIAEPEKKYVVFSDGKVQMYQAKINDLKTYPAGKNKAEFETFLVLGFGGSGHEMQKSFDVTYAGEETLDGVKAAKLDLVPKSDRIRNTFQHIVLWIDPARGVSVQQQLFEPSGDYRLAKYSNIQLNQKIADTVFKIKH